MNSFRMTSVNKAFKKFDKSGDGNITIDDLKNVYDVTKHPKFLNGEWDENQVLTKFLNSFDSSQHKDGIVRSFSNSYSTLNSIHILLL
jgi:calcyphosin